ncbi:DUF3558 family protein [Actinokineospora sp. 24-640]
MVSTLARGIGLTVIALSVIAPSVACSAEPGVPAPSATGQADIGPAPTTAASTTTSAGPRTVSLDREALCALLTEAEAARFGSRSPREGNSTATGNPQCQWRGEMGLTLEFSDSGTYTPEAGATGITVDGLPAFLVPVAEEQFCKVVVRLNEGVSGLAMGAGVLSAGEGKGRQPCDVAKQLAEIVIPKVKG